VASRAAATAGHPAHRTHGYEAIQNVGEAAFADAATNEAIAHVREGLPLRAELALVGYLARAGT
jgi:predicted N-acetyltransferase YhbS